LSAAAGLHIVADAARGTNQGNEFLWSLAVNAYPDVAVPAAELAAKLNAVAVKESHFNASSVSAFKSLNELLGSAPGG
jgi:hypothetical protein